MKARLGLLIAVLGASAVALSAAAQGSNKLSVDDELGYYCPDGRQIYIFRCYDESAQASCQYVAAHKPMTNNFQFEALNTRAELLASLTDCTLTPVTFDNRGVVTLKKPAQTAQAKPPAAATTVTVIDGWAIGVKNVRSSLVHVKPRTPAFEHYVDVASRQATSRKNVVAIWSLRVILIKLADFPDAKAIWAEYLADCKANTYELGRYIALDPQAKVLVEAVSGTKGNVEKGTTNEAIVAIACQSAPPPAGPRFASAAAAIADISASAAGPTKVAPPAPVAPPAVAPIRLPETETEKTFFQLLKTNQLQAAVSTILKFPDGKSMPIIKLTDEQGMTALHWVTANRNAAGIRWLLDKGPNVDLADGKGRTPLKIAFDNKDSRAMTLLLERGADARFALPGHDEELTSFKKTSELVDFLIKSADPAKN